MPGPKPPEIVLPEEQRSELERLVRARTSEQQLAMRARIVLLAAAGVTTEEIARQLHIDVDNARRWRARWHASADIPVDELSVAERLADAPKSGRPARITPEQICRVIRLACEIPAESDRPISHWSAREVADEIMQRGIIDHISPRHAGRLLKRGGPQAPPDPLLAHAGRKRGGSGAGGQDQ